MIFMDVIGFNHVLDMDSYRFCSVQVNIHFKIAFYPALSVSLKIGLFKATL